jgi:hypothetical protein
MLTVLPNVKEPQHHLGGIEACVDVESPEDSPRASDVFGPFFLDLEPGPAPVVGVLQQKTMVWT